MHQKAFLRFIFLLTIVANPLKLLSAARTTTFDLISRDHLLGRPRTQRERLSQMLHNDMVRMQRVSSLKQQNVGPTALRDNKATAVTTIKSGASFGSGEYFAELMVGTPPQVVLLVADTGSDLNFMNCNYNRKKNPKGLVFRADNSSSFRAIPCSSDLCAGNLTYLYSQPDLCQSPRTPCPYNYSYGGGSAATQGIFAFEKLTFKLTNGKETALENMLIGCSTSGQGLGTTLNGSHGVMGLGNSPFSLPMQASQLFGNNVLSYCLVDHLSANTTSSKLVFGSPPIELMPEKMQYTKLDVKAIVPFYAVKIEAIYINGTRLNIPANYTWNNYGQGGTVLDSGMSLTPLATPAYGPVTAALNNSLSQFLKPIYNDVDLEYCYESKGYNESWVPKLEIAFSGGARFKPPPKSYVIDVSPTMKCLGFVNAGWPSFSTIGNIMQQEHFWKLDIDKGKLGFASSLCTSL